MFILRMRKCFKRKRCGNSWITIILMVTLVLFSPYMYPLLYAHVFNGAIRRSENNSDSSVILSQQLYSFLNKNSKNKFWSWNSSVTLKTMSTVEHKHAPVLTPSTQTMLMSTAALTNSTKPSCSDVSVTFKGREKPDVKHRTMETLESLHQEGIEFGGRFRPKGCNPLFRVAIVVPFRDRDVHFNAFIHNVIPKLKRQLVDFTIYKVEQEAGNDFNRGMMRNVGFAEASKLADYDCYIFNDVDTIFEDDRNIFKCGKKRVRHLMTGVDIFKYKLLYDDLIGGIISFTKHQFLKTNGYSNFYFVWGSEDDDMFRRMNRANLTIERPQASYGLVKTLKHKRDKVRKFRNLIYNFIGNNTQEDGLSSLRYKLLSIDKHQLFTRVYVRVNQTDITEDLYSIAPNLRTASRN